MTLLYFLIVLSLIVFVHELGHFLAARLTGVRVEVFSIGFGKRILGWRRGDTDYRISLVPLGGYVRMAGIIDESAGLPAGEETTLTGEEWEFMSKNWLQKVFILAAGGVMNFLLAWVIFAILLFSAGVYEAENLPVIGEATPGWPAAEAGLQSGDRLLEINGESLTTWEELSQAVHAWPNKTISLKLERDGMILQDSVTTRAEQILVDGHLVEAGLIGISPPVTHRAVGPLESLWLAAERSIDLLNLSITQIRIMISGEASLKDLGGPIFIAQLSGEAARNGVISFFSFIAVISLHIGFLNLLPLPVLDGGHIVINTVEAIIRRPLSLELKLRIQQVGLILLLFLMLVALRNDLLRIGLFGGGN